MTNQSNESQRKTELAEFAARVLREPSQMRLLSDRVHQLLIDDLRQQKERGGRNYEGRL
jgi:hypothetical protein